MPLVVISDASPLHYLILIGNAEAVYDHTCPNCDWTGMSSRIQYRGEAASLLSRRAAAVCSPGRKPGVNLVLRSSPVGAKDSRESVAPTVLTLERAEIPGLAPGATLLSPLRGSDRMRCARYFGQQWS